MVRKWKARTLSAVSEQLILPLAQFLIINQTKMAFVKTLAASLVLAGSTT